MRAGVEFRDDLPDGRIRLQLETAVDPDADLGTAVAAEDGAVLNQGYAKAQPGRTDRSAGARHASADDHKIERAPIGGLNVEPQEAPAKVRQGHAFVGRAKRGIGGEEDRVAAAVEARQVAKRESGLA